MRILLVEDEPAAAAIIAKGLREVSYAVDVAQDGETALYTAAINHYDAIVLDILLPKIDGVEVCRQLRRGGDGAPILMLTARGAARDRIAGLDAGADDYLTKPFAFGELLARLRALIRRRPLPLMATHLRVAGLEIDTLRHRVFGQGREIVLSAREYALLEFLAYRAGEVLGRAEIAEHVWDENYNPLSNVVDVFIQRLRRKLDVPGTPSKIETLRGAGYRLNRGEEDRG